MKLTLHTWKKKQDGGDKGVSIIQLPPDVDTERPEVQSPVPEVTRSSGGHGVRHRSVWVVVLSVFLVVSLLVIGTAVWRIADHYSNDRIYEKHHRKVKDDDMTHNSRRRPHHQDRPGSDHMSHGHGHIHHSPVDMPLDHGGRIQHPPLDIPKGHVGHIHHPPADMPLGHGGRIHHPPADMSFGQVGHIHHPPAQMPQGDDLIQTKPALPTMPPGLLSFIHANIVRPFMRPFIGKFPDNTGSDQSRETTGNDRDIVETEVACASIGSQPERCLVQGHIVDIKVKDQRSEAECKPNQSFFTRGHILVVDHGCAALFTVKVKKTTGSDGSEVQASRHGSTEVTCSSVDFKPAWCEVRGQIVEVKVTQQLSESVCLEGLTYFATQNFIIVHSGCRAVFDVKVMN